LRGEFADQAVGIGCDIVGAWITSRSRAQRYDEMRRSRYGLNV
jgi:hypothetical protein